MIPPPFQHRFEGDSGIDVGTQEIDAVFPDSQRTRVVLRIGAPFQRGEDWCIRAELENLDRTDGPFFSTDSLTALVMGIRWLVLRLRVFTEAHECQYYWPDSDELFDAEKLFSTTHSSKKSEASNNQQSTD